MYMYTSSRAQKVSISVREGSDDSQPSTLESPRTASQGTKGGKRGAKEGEEEGPKGDQTVVPAIRVLFLSITVCREGREHSL